MHSAQSRVVIARLTAVHVTSYRRLVFLCLTGLLFGRMVSAVSGVRAQAENVSRGVARCSSLLSAALISVYHVPSVLKLALSDLCIRRRTQTGVTSYDYQSTKVTLYSRIVTTSLYTWILLTHHPNCRIWLISVNEAKDSFYSPPLSMLLAPPPPPSLLSLSPAVAGSTHH